MTDFDITPPDAEVAAAARTRQDRLTKPPGSLGRLEDLSVWVASCQGVCPPRQFQRPRFPWHLPWRSAHPIATGVSGLRIDLGGRVSGEEAWSPDRTRGLAPDSNLFAFYNL